MNKSSQEISTSISRGACGAPSLLARKTPIGHGSTASNAMRLSVTRRNAPALPILPQPGEDGRKQPFNQVDAGRKVQAEEAN